MLYTDDSILAGPDSKELDSIIEDMKSAELHLTVEGDIAHFLGVKIERSEDGKSFNLTQQHLIDDILKELRLEADKTAIKRTTGASSKPLLRCPNVKPFNCHFKYRRVIGKLNYLEKCTRIDATCVTHQCARFVGKPKDVHGKAVKWIGRYLAGTKDKGIIMAPDKMLLLLVIGIQKLQNGTVKLQGQERDVSSCLLVAPYCGHQEFRVKWRCQLPRANTLQF